MDMTQEIISEKELEVKLYEFKHTLLNYDYSDVDNVIFFNIESFNWYLKRFKNNPFEKQYNELEEIFKVIMPYIPSTIPDEAIDTITHILEAQYDDKELIKKNILFNIKMDFIEMVKDLSSQKNWDDLVAQCQEIRKAKVALHQEQRVFI
ncbi:hypothetical protein EDC19_2377 [Natranaerovirga hydrolytica]|uniref:Uncharacterized protein n=1 Tax=Natranaerovirga hydrolytica TaxID=680378 RepID=A0A4R1MDK7_9FIRM|nr:hypothetical protein [Natranaerovirga hydrolytica]TCK90608.1 hypothetical protein EDC19_2377 [Natranaerovirga hydrolytica]